MSMILAKGVTSGVELQGVESRVRGFMDIYEEKYVVVDEYGGIHIYNSKETVTVEEPFEVRCNANFENEECMNAFMKIYDKEKEIK